MGNPASEEERLLDQYRSAAQEERLLCQLELAERLIRLHPDRAVHWMRLGQCQTWGCRLDAAEESLQRGLSLDPDPKGRALCLRLLGSVSEARGDFEVARERYLMAHATRPDDASPLRDLGGMLLGQGRTSEATSFLMQAIECSEGTLGLPLLRLCRASVAEGRAGEARTWAKRALDLDPEFECARNWLEDLDACRDLDPHEDELLDLVRDAGDRGRAICELELAERIANLNPNRARDWARLGSCQIELLRLDDAEESLQRALSSTSKPRGRCLVLRLLGHVSAALGDLAAAEERYLASHEALPTHTGPLIYLGGMLLGRGRTTEAEPLLMKAKECSEGDIDEVYYNLAGVCVVEGRLEEARTWTERALELDPDYEDAHRRLADLDALRDLE